MSYRQPDWWRYINDVGTESEATRVTVARLTDQVRADAKRQGETKRIPG